MAVIECILVTKLDDEERTAWEDADLVKAQLAFSKRDFIAETKAEAQVKAEVEAQVAEKNRKIIVSAYQKGLNEGIIAAVTDLPIENVKAIIDAHTKGI